MPSRTIKLRPRKLADKPAAVTSAATTKPASKLASAAAKPIGKPAAVAKPAASGPVAALSEAAVTRRIASFTGNYPVGETANAFDNGFLLAYYKLFGSKPFNRSDVAHMRFDVATCGQRNRGDDNGRISRLPKLGLLTYDKQSGRMQITAAGVKLASLLTNRKPAKAA